MNNASKRLLSLLLVACMLVGILAVLPISIPVSAASDIATSGNYFFKVGAKSALANGSRVTFEEAPFEYGGEVYIPVSALTAVSATPTAGTTTVNGVQAVSLTNIPTAYSGYYASLSNMNLIAVSQTQNLFSGHTDDEQVTLMKKFLFAAIGTDGTTKNTVFDIGDMKSTNHPYLYADQDRFDELAAVWAKGQAGEAVDEVLYGYIDELVENAKRLYAQYAQVDANGDYLSMNTTVGLVRGHQDYIYEIPYQTTGSGYNDGYDAGGRLNEAANNNNRILQLAFAYQMTKDINYAKLAYQYAIYMGQWEHWGPGHFLNCADASSPYAIAYDWLYGAWAELESDGATCLYFDGSALVEKAVTVAAIEEIIFTHSIVPAYYSINVTDKTASNVPWFSTTVKAGGYDYHVDTNNWNAVCSAGITVAALALAGSTTSTSEIKIDNTINGVYSADTSFTEYGSHSGMSTYQDYAEWLVNANLYYLPLNGLGQYVPYGDYIESNGYWSYGTNNLYEMAAALTSATGSHYGLLDAWGMDKTAYFALNTMSSDGLSWNYHDSNQITAQDTSWFMYLGHDEGQGDKALAGIRKDLNASIAKQQASYYDVIYYMSDDEIGEFKYPELQYYMEGIDGYAMRDSWNAEEGTLFAGFMGEANNVTHGQVDSGAFVYYNKGTRWFCDLGTEEYNAYEFWTDGYRQNYYAMGAEGNNTLIITGDVLSDSDKEQGNGDGALDRTTFFGQYLNGSGSITSQGSNAYGSFAILNNTSAYDYEYTYTTSSTSCGSTTTNTKSGTGSAASSALRGMFLTNDRKTFVIQDQVTFNHAQDVAWVGHIVPEVEVMLSVDKTVAYLSDGNTVIKVTLLDPDGAGLTFRHAFCTDDEFLLDETHGYDYSVGEMGDETANKDYSEYQKLIIEKSGVTEFNVAVVIEEVILGETMNDAEGIGYTWTDMNSWTPYADGRDSGSTGGDGGDGETGPVATVTVTVVEKDNTLDPDTPVVDLWSASAAAAAVAAASEEAASGETTVYTANTFEELQSIINNNKGNITVVDLAASNGTPITINAPCTVNTNGNKLLATSASYVAEVNGDTVEYKSGSVTVTWVLTDGSRITEAYTGSTVASYKGTITESSSIYEVDNGDGTYSYYTSGNAWALTEKGKQASSNELIVTSENNVFYQTGKAFEGLFVTVSGSTITGYYSANDFFSSTVFGKKYDRISITDDFSYDATDKADVHTFSAPANLYMNGKTLTYTSASTSNHMFVANGGDLCVYGPGGITSQAEASNIFYNDVTNGDNIYVENVDLYSVRAVIDLRCNTATFKNCNITIEKNNSAFTVINRNNAAAVAPYLYVDDCVVNMLVNSDGTGVVSMNLNAKAELTGGTSIKTASACPLFQLNNSTVGTVDGFDYANAYQEMYAIIGELYHTLSTISKTSTNDASGATYDLSGRVFYGEGYKSDTDISALNVMPGFVIAKTGESSYVIADPADCASVSWMNGSTVLATEYWYKGTTPVASAEIKGKVTIGDGQMITFATEEVTAGASYEFKATTVDAFALKVNMSLQTDFHLNFFVENIGAMTFKIDGVEVTPDTTAMEGYYKVAKTNINPTSAGKSVKLEVTYNGVTVTKTISIVDYARLILSDTTGAYSDAAKAMMINVIKYVDAAYAYVGNDVGATADEYTKIYNLYRDYKSLATVSVVNRQPAATSEVNDAIRGAQYELADSPKLRFNLNDTYSGEVTINGTVYNVVNGVCGGKTYIEISYKAFDLLDALNITTAKGTASYSLANYYYYYATEQGELTNLLNALYAYCETARNYQNSL